MHDKPGCSESERPFSQAQQITQSAGRQQILQLPLLPIPKAVKIRVVHFTQACSTMLKCYLVLTKHLKSINEE